jgi:serine/threonine protein phosphatase PrpC
VAPRLDSDDCGFFSVFDGTVGDFASHTIHTLFLPHLVGNPSFQASKQTQNQSEHMKLVGSGIHEAFVSSDKELVQACAQSRQDYSSSTGVVAVVSAGILTVAHIGDSRVGRFLACLHFCSTYNRISRHVSRSQIALGSMEGNGNLCAEFLTVDHKPDTPAERARIEAVSDPHK